MGNQQTGSVEKQRSNRPKRVQSDVPLKEAASGNRQIVYQSREPSSVSSISNPTNSKDHEASMSATVSVVNSYAESEKQHEYCGDDQLNNSYRREASRNGLQHAIASSASDVDGISVTPHHQDESSHHESLHYNNQNYRRDSHQQSHTHTTDKQLQQPQQPQQLQQPQQPQQLQQLQKQQQQLLLQQQPQQLQQQPQQQSIDPNLKGVSQQYQGYSNAKLQFGVDQVDEHLHMRSDSGTSRDHQDHVGHDISTTNSSHYDFIKNPLNDKVEKMSKHDEFISNGVPRFLRSGEQDDGPENIQSDVPITVIMDSDFPRTTSQNPNGLKSQNSNGLKSENSNGLESQNSNGLKSQNSNGLKSQNSNGLKSGDSNGLKSQNSNGLKSEDSYGLKSEFSNSLQSSPQSETDFMFARYLARDLPGGQSEDPILVSSIPGLILLENGSNELPVDNMEKARDNNELADNLLATSAKIYEESAEPISVVDEKNVDQQQHRELSSPSYREKLPSLSVALPHYSEDHRKGSLDHDNKCHRYGPGWDGSSSGISDHDDQDKANTHHDISYVDVRMLHNEDASCAAAIVGSPSLSSPLISLQSPHAAASVLPESLPASFNALVEEPRQPNIATPDTSNRNRCPVGGLPPVVGFGHSTTEYVTTSDHEKQLTGQLMVESAINEDVLIERGINEEVLIERGINEDVLIERGINEEI